MGIIDTVYDIFDQLMPKTRNNDNIVNAIGHLCEAAWHHPDLEVSYNKLTVKLKSHDVDGITDRDFELAAKIEAVTGWSPSRGAGALTGPPKSQRILADQA